MTLRKRGPEKSQERCPNCSGPVDLKPAGEGLKMFNPDGELHRCREQRPIGQALVVHTIQGFNLRGRRAQILLDGGDQFEIYAIDYRPLKLRLITKDGILEE